MGFLKHILLPYFASFQALTVICMLPQYREWFVGVAYHRDLNQEQEEQDVVVGEDRNTISNNSDLNYVEHHLLDAAAGFHAAMAYGCVAGTVYGSDKFRLQIVSMEVILWFFDWYGSLSNQQIESTVMAVNLTLALLGAFVHYQLEPRLFPKDENKTKWW